eukprot:GILK01007723.1.p1 GENE.GILK01007723.1~~GILK01007723.1.p1  ORF type:complete len:666 (-),score=84.72 GILK01007723.1:138-1973(-)
MEDSYFLSRPEKFKRALQKINRLHVIRKQRNLTADQFNQLYIMTGEASPLFLHQSVFLPFLKSQCTPEQQQMWVPLAEDLRITGCYAQTELGHGSNVRGIETTATFISESDEIEIHSPTLTSTKWWVGGLGLFSTHAVVMARLIVHGKDLGMHPFFVQLRSLTDHQPLKGVTVGDIGPKMGFNTVDNGFARFDHVRIPRSHMLMRYSKLSREGVYSKPPHDKLSYIGMVSVRTALVAAAAYGLARSTVIAVRYSAVRRQFGEQGQAEKQILDYQNQQYRVLPHVATAYALNFTAKFMTQLFTSLTGDLQHGDLSVLAELHATASGLKCWTSYLAVEGMDECRLACGGHGFSLFSGIPEYAQGFAHILTAEGENNILARETTRYLVKILAKPELAKSNASYLASAGDVLEQKCSAVSIEDMMHPDVQLKAFVYRAVRLVVRVGQDLQAAMSSGVPASDLWNVVHIEANKASKAHCLYVMLLAFNSNLSRDAMTPSLLGILTKLRNLFSLYHIERSIGDFSEDSYFSAEQCSFVRAGIRQLMNDIRTDAVALVDALNFSDHVLNSALGRSDGMVYERLYELAQREPLNQTAVVDGYQEYLRPLIHGQAARSKL